MHQDPKSNFIVYGGAVKALAEGQVSGLFPLAWYLGMNSGTHDAQTYPSDFVQSMYGAGQDGGHEELRSRIEVVAATDVPGREDIGILTVRLIADKLVTNAGMIAFKAVLTERAVANLKIREEGSERLIQVLSLEQVLAVPTERAFR